MPRPIKGAAFAVGVSLYKNDGTLVANPGTVTAKISKDFGDYADIGTVTEEDSTYSQLKLALTATEMNADVVSLYVTDDTSGTVPWTATIYTEEANLAADVIAVSGDTTAADNLELAYDGTGYAGGTTKPDVNVVSMAADTLTAAALKADAVAEIQSGLAKDSTVAKDATVMAVKLRTDTLDAATGTLTLSFRLLLDSDGDGIADDPAVGVDGVTCHLLAHGTHTRIRESATTDSQGYVYWHGLAAGTYDVDPDAAGYEGVTVAVTIPE